MHGWRAAWEAFASWVNHGPLWLCSVDSLLEDAVPCGRAHASCSAWWRCGHQDGTWSWALADEEVLVRREAAVFAETGESARKWR